MKKIPLILAFGAGYVVGTKAGRERYDQIKTQAQKTWASDSVQSVVAEAETKVKQAASDIGDKVAEAAAEAKDVVVEKLNDDDGPAITLVDEVDPAVDSPTTDRPGG